MKNTQKTFLEKIPELVAGVTEFEDVDQARTDDEVVIGKMDDYTKALYTLHSQHIDTARLFLTRYRSADSDSPQKAEISRKINLEKSMGQVFLNLMWVHIQEVLLSEKINADHICIRSGDLIVSMPNPRF